MNKRWWIGACLVIAALVSGCHSGGRNQNSTSLRAVNAVVDAEPLDVLVDSNTCSSGIAFGGVSGYCQFDAGNREVRVRSSTTQSVLVDRTLSFGSDTNETLVVYGRRASIQTTTLVDDTPAPSSGKFKIHVADFSPEASAVDLYLVTSADISSAASVIGGAAYPTATDYVEVTPGSYQIILTLAGTKDVIFTAPARNFAAGAKLTLLVLPSLGGKLVNAMLLSADTGASGVLLTNASARIKAVNAMPGSTLLNFKVDNSVVFSNVPYQGSSSYALAPSGSHSLAIEASNAPGSNLVSITSTLTAASDYTLVAQNSVSSPGLVVLADDNTVPAAGFARVRFANVMPAGSTAVDVLVNFASQVTNLATGTASSYTSLAAATTFTISFTTPGGATVLATLNTGALDSGSVYTVYLFGLPSAPQPIIVKDR